MESTARSEASQEHDQPVLPRIYEQASDLVLFDVLTRFLKLSGCTKNTLRVTCKRLLSCMDDSVVSIVGKSPSPSLGLPSTLAALFFGHHMGQVRWPNLTTFDVGGMYRSICSLQGIPSTIQFLSIANCSLVHTLAPISACTLLKELNCSKTAVSNLSHLTSCAMLEVLNLNGCRRLTPTCLQSLTALTNLRDLNCGSVQNLDLSTLSGLVSLSSLNLSGRSANDISPISSCLGLTRLCLRECTDLSDLRPLSVLVHLVELDIDYTMVTDLMPLSPCTLLKELVCDFRFCFYQASLETIFKLHKLKSPAIMAHVNQQLNYISGVDPVPWADHINHDTIRDQLRNVMVTSSSLGDLELAIKVLLDLHDNEYDETMTGETFDETTCYPLVRCLLSTSNLGIASKIIQVLSSISGWHRQKFEGIPTFLPTLIGFLHVEHCDDVHSNAAEALANFVGISDDDDFELEETEEERTKMNGIRSQILSQHGLLDSLMDMVSMDGSTRAYLRSQALCALRKLAGDQDLKVGYVGRTDVVRHHENSALIAAHPGLLNRVQELAEAPALDTEYSVDSFSALSLLATLASHDPGLVSGYITAAKRYLDARDAVSKPYVVDDQEVFGSVWSLDCQLAHSWVIDLLKLSNSDGTIKHLLLAKIIMSSYKCVRSASRLQVFRESDIYYLLVSLLESEDPEIVEVSLEMINHILSCWDDETKVAFSSLHGSLISLLVDFLESDRAKTSLLAVSSLSSLSSIEENKDRITNTKHALSLLTLVMLNNDDESAIYVSTIFTNLMTGNESRRARIGNFPGAVKCIANLVLKSEKSAYAALTLLAEDEGFAKTIYRHPGLVQCLTNNICDNNNWRDNLVASYRLLKALSAHCAVEIAESSVVMGTLVAELNGARRYDSHTCRIIAAETLTNLACVESVKAKILATNATTFLADLQDDPNSSEEVKQAATAALEKILAEDS